MPDVEVKITVVMETCASCKIPFWIEKEHQKRLKESHERFFCPNGHGLSYPGKTDLQIIEEKDRSLKLAEDARIALQKEKLELEKEKAKLKKSVDSYKGYFKSRKIPPPAEPEDKGGSS